MKVLFKVDVTNENKVISKDHDLVIYAGTEIDFDPVPERVEKFIKMGVAAAIHESSQESDPEPPADPDVNGEDDADQEPEQEPGQLPDDLDELKAMADELGVDYAPNIGAKKLKERIQSHLEK